MAFNHSTFQGVLLLGHSIYYPLLYHPQPLLAVQAHLHLLQTACFLATLNLAAKVGGKDYTNNDNE